MLDNVSVEVSGVPCYGLNMSYGAAFCYFVTVCLQLCSFDSIYTIMKVTDLYLSCVKVSTILPVSIYPSLFGSVFLIESALFDR